MHKGYPTEKGSAASKELKHQTLQPLGQGKHGMDTTPIKGLFPIDATSYVPEADSTTQIINLTGHPVKVGNVILFDAGVNIGEEVVVTEIINANSFKIAHPQEVAIIPADTFRILQAKSVAVDSDGNFVVSQGPIQFLEDTVAEEVEIDTAVPANNKPLPVGMYVVKDGILYPVTKDTVTPANTISIPVEIVGTAGTEINITAGDINVQLGHTGVNFDSTRIGDGTNLMGVNADLEALVHDADTHSRLDTGNASLASIDTKMDAQSTAALQTTGNTSLASIDLRLQAQATAANQATINANLVSIDTKLDDQATAARQDTGNVSLASIDNKLATLGQKSSAGSLPAVLSAEQELILSNIRTNTTGIATEAKQDTIITNQGTQITNEGLILAELQAINGQTSVKSIVDVISPIDISSSNIPANLNPPLEIIGATSAAVTKVQTIEDVGEYIGLYTGASGSENLVAILPIAGGEVEVAIPLGTRLSIRHMKNSAISTSTFFAANLVG